MPRPLYWLSRFALALSLLLLAPTARAEGVVSTMATCDAVAKMPPLLMLAGFGVRGIGTAITGGSSPFIRAGREEGLFLASLGTASVGHALCGPAALLGYKQYENASLSLGLRLGLPSAAFVVTYGAYRSRANRGDFGDAPSDVIGASTIGIAIMGGFVLDYLLLTRREAKPVQAAQPFAVPTSGGLVAGAAFAW